MMIILILVRTWSDLEPKTGNFCRMFAKVGVILAGSRAPFHPRLPPRERTFRSMMSWLASMARW